MFWLETEDEFKENVFKFNLKVTENLRKTHENKGKSMLFWREKTLFVEYVPPSSRCSLERT